ncbi:unnamed protein product (macronuclear) [Paramecium tetraurelia]|uniref:Protein kinase domain-containing protein n=1 Tax=Paramecium tetraurelia TaxID=5888 RepID=A0BI46_PARTE|nr:uncharacterized protein GSPATT00029249001 [Paramecium tetraurelia]CAK58213.1 unnamed protein product [Paramecium tetraurelia]|eukprot:XP_001425611.1 hypothetical protein (macronuclear) [Paramecium tetraurelia strain d4-2]
MRQIKDFMVNQNEALGAGAYGTAHKCYRIGNKDELFCMKIIKKSINTDQKKELSQKRQLEAEIKTFQSLKDANCENLVKMIDIIDEDSRLCIVMELCDLDLDKLLRQFHYMNTWPSIIEMEDMMKQILKGAQVLIDNHIIHRDIKPQNILVKILNKGQPTERKIYKIADFGFTKYLDDIYAKANLTRVGTRSYCAPEILKGQNFSSKCDIYSYGIVFHQIAYKFSFPSHYDNQQQLHEFHESISKSPYKCADLKGGQMIMDLIEKMLIFDQDKRIQFEDLWAHSVMKTPNRILKDSIFVRLDRSVQEEDYKQQIVKNEAEKLKRLNLLTDIFYRKFLLCKHVADFMKNTLIVKQIDHLIFQQFISLIGLYQINYGFAMLNCLISDFEPTILLDNDVPQLIELLNYFMVKSQENKEYVGLQNRLTKDYYQAIITYKQDLNTLLKEKIESKNWKQYEVVFKQLQQSQTRKIPIEKCYQVIQYLKEQDKIKEFISKCKNQPGIGIAQSLQTIMELDTKFNITYYRDINPDDIFKI